MRSTVELKDNIFPEITAESKAEEIYMAPERAGNKRAFGKEDV